MTTSACSVTHPPSAVQASTGMSMWYSCVNWPTCWAKAADTKLAPKQRVRA
eukprot:CAMPEP_0115268706 /NCGR_PEP_ID=MMETSP0270-20121206/52656_1 /TAXON_ID=71861 /ORGANISM="Scrippsiella trochoidea, Strain CCMP3099" /LENGTH=50 /DNA_ID=CAMNT_0002684911 /DNA_START=24 /DNA_END=173 /DNA_ORIENTATION=+